MEDIKNYTILNLKKMARQNNYTGYTKMNKLDLYNFLNSKNIDNTPILQPIKGIPKPLDKKKKEDMGRKSERHKLRGIYGV